MLWIKSQQPEALLNPKLQGKLVLVLLLTVNAVVLHRWTFPRLARGRSVGRWRAADWIVVVMPVALSNCLWMFCAFLGIARPWNDSMPMRDVLEIAATLYAVALVGVACVLAAASRPQPDEAGGSLKLFKRALASIGRLGQDRNTAAAAENATQAAAAALQPGARRRERLDVRETPHADRERARRARRAGHCRAAARLTRRGSRAPSAETLEVRQTRGTMPLIAQASRRHACQTSSSARSPARRAARGRASRPPRAAPP